MKQYIISGQKIQEVGIGLERIPGFNVFSSSDFSEKPLLTIEVEKNLQNWSIKPIHSFIFEEIVCDFAYHDGIYFFRMIKQQEGDPWLIEIRSQDNAYLAKTNMDQTTTPYLVRFAVWMTFGIASTSKKTMAIHASTISCNHKSILFLGESGTGKSTHTRLWLNSIPDTELLNDDSPFVSTIEGSPFVYGSPWSGKTPCYKNKKSSIAAFVRLSQASSNQIKRLNKMEALGALQPSCPPSFFYEELLSERVYETLSDLLQQVPVYSLACLPNASAAELVYSTLKEDGRL